MPSSLIQSPNSRQADPNAHMRRMQRAKQNNPALDMKGGQSNLQVPAYVHSDKNGKRV